MTPHSPWSRSVIRDLGADVVALAPQHHDALVAVVSHVPHLTAATLMHLADEAATEHRALLRLAAGGFRDMTRIAAGHPGIWPDICAENRDAIVEVLDGLIDALATSGPWWRPTTAPRCSAVLEASRAARLNLPSRSSGPRACARSGSRCRTAPGVLAEVTTLAGRLDVNIADLEIAHSAEGDRGVLILLVEAAAAERLRTGLVEARLPAGRGAAGVAVLADPLPIKPVTRPLAATSRVPGSKSLTNRALVCAALADGDERARARPGGRRHRRDALRAGRPRHPGRRGRPARRGGRRDLRVRGCAGRPPATVAVVDARLSGTTSRFLLPVAALAVGTVRVDGALPLRARPMGPVDRRPAPARGDGHRGGGARPPARRAHRAARWSAGSSRSRGAPRASSSPACSWPARRCGPGWSCGWPGTSCPGRTST